MNLLSSHTIINSSMFKLESFLDHTLSLVTFNTIFYVVQLFKHFTYPEHPLVPLHLDN